MKGPANPLPQIEVPSRAPLRSWLKAHHATSRSVWLVTWKKGAPRPACALRRHRGGGALLRVGGQPAAQAGAERSMLLLSPRRPGSAWSAANKARIERLAAAGLLHRAGLAAGAGRAVRRQLDLPGRIVQRLDVPADLAAALAARPGAAGHFDRFPRSVRRGILEWIKQARRPETRAKRIEETARLAAENRRANQFERPRRDPAATEAGPDRPPRRPLGACHRRPALARRAVGTVYVDVVSAKPGFRCAPGAPNSRSR